jgi:drug/metabolite transporter (DMT)-like permease
LQTKQQSGSKKEAIVFTLIASSLWGTSFPAIKIGLEYMDAYTFVFWRFFLATVIMLAVVLFTRDFRLNLNKKRLLLLLGVINGVAYLLQYVGMVSTFASNSSLLVNLTVVWVALLSPIIVKEKLGRKKIAGVFLSITGIVLITTKLHFQSFHVGETVGNLLVIAAGILWALFIIYNKQLVNENENLTQSLTWLLLFTMLPLIPVVPLSSTNFLALRWEAWLAIGYTAIFCWVIPYYLWSKGLKKISPVTSSVILLNETLVAITISILVLGEALTIVSGVGAVFILMAMLLVSY